MKIYGKSLRARRRRVLFRAMERLCAIAYYEAKREAVILRVRFVVGGAA